MPRRWQPWFWPHAWPPASRALPVGTGPLGSLLAERPDPQAITRALPLLDRRLEHVVPDAADLACIERAWPVSLAVEALLASGGDERLSLDSASGLNRYGCAPWPRPAVLGFASCTASSLSQPAFVAAERARRILIAHALRTGAPAAVSGASEAAEASILAHFGVADLASAVLAASGTDAALIVTGLLAAEHPGTAMTSILVSPAETGSGVPDAVQGRHFAGLAPSGRLVTKGDMLEGLRTLPRLATIALRDENGAPLPPAAIAAACRTAIAAAIPHGRVVLHAIDGSKTGLTAPDRATLLQLAAEAGGALDIVIDACQARLEPALVRWYLEQGFPVLVTGSKFFAAPGFCGAVLFPRARLDAVARTGRVADGLAPYACLEGGIGSRRCPGLLLRWEAALHDMAVFGALPAAEIGQRLDRLGQRVSAVLRQHPRLHLVAAPRPPGLGWSDRRSVFTFAVRDQAGWIAPAALRDLYLVLQAEAGGPTVQLGQPVVLGHPALGGLRIAFSAAQLAGADDVAASLRVALDRLGSALDPPRAKRPRIGMPALVTG